MSKLLRWVVSGLVAVAFLSPLLWMLVGSFREEAMIFSSWFADGALWTGWTADNYADAWRRSSLGQALLVSLAQVLAIAGFGLMVNSLAAYAFARMTFRGRDVLFGLVVIRIVLPVEVLAVPLFFTARDLGLTGAMPNALLGLALPFFAKAFNIYFLRQHFLTVPRELEEAAAMDGAGPWRQFWSVSLPSIKPALATVVLLDLLFHWGDFLWPLLIGSREETRTVQIGLANLFTQPPIQWGDILAGAVIATLPVVLLFRWCQRWLVITEARAGIK